MVNASLNWASIVGIALVIAGFVPFFKKSISTQYDPFLVPIFWLCGLILFFQGWRLDPILQFGQFLLAGVVFFVGYENIKLRELIKKLKNQGSEESKFKKEDVKEQKDESHRVEKGLKDILKTLTIFPSLTFQKILMNLNLKRLIAKKPENGILI